MCCESDGKFHDVAHSLVDRQMYRSSLQFTFFRLSRSSSFSFCVCLSIFFARYFSLYLVLFRSFSLFPSLLERERERKCRSFSFFPSLSTAFVLILSFSFSFPFPFSFSLSTSLLTKIARTIRSCHVKYLKCTRNRFYHSQFRFQCK